MEFGISSHALGASEEKSQVPNVLHLPHFHCTTQVIHRLYGVSTKWKILFIISDGIPFSSLKFQLQKFKALFGVYTKYFLQITLPM